MISWNYILITFILCVQLKTKKVPNIQLGLCRSVGISFTRLFSRDFFVTLVSVCEMGKEPQWSFVFTIIFKLQMKKLISTNSLEPIRCRPPTGLDYPATILVILRNTTRWRSFYCHKFHIEYPYYSYCVLTLHTKIWV